jgi:hypothetical protein
MEYHMYSEERIFQDVESNYSKLYKYLTVNMLFTKSLEDLFKLKIKGKSTLRTCDIESINSRIMRANNRSWQNARSENCDYRLKIRSDEEIAYEKRKRSMACVPVC